MPNRHSKAAQSAKDNKGERFKQKIALEAEHWRKCQNESTKGKASLGGIVELEPLVSPNNAPRRSVDVLIDDKQRVEQHRFGQFRQQLAVQSEAVEEVDQLTANCATGPEPETDDLDILVGDLTINLARSLRRSLLSPSAPL